MPLQICIEESLISTLTNIKNRSLGTLKVVRKGKKVGEKNHYFGVRNTRIQCSMQEKGEIVQGESTFEIGDEKTDRSRLMRRIENQGDGHVEGNFSGRMRRLGRKE